MVASTYGWTHQEILALTARQFFLYLHQITKLNAIKQLRDFEVSLMPHIDKTNRIELFKSYQEVLIPMKVDQDEINDSWQFLRRKKRGL